jgi:hypothetical protein
MTTMTAEQLRVAQTKRLEVNRPANQILDLMRGLINFDAAMAAKRKKAGCSIPLGFVLAIGLFFGSGFTFGWMKTVMLALGGFCVVAAVVCIFLYVKLRREDLSDNLTTTAAPFIALLREDMNPGDPLHVDIDLRSWEVAEKKKKESEPYKRGSYHKIIDRLYVDPWFSGNATLADGTKLRWKVVDHLLQKKASKRNARGKIKTKTKVKRKTVAVVTLAFPTKAYAVKDASDVERDAKRATMTLARKKKSAGEESAALDMLVDLIADGYRRVNLARSA